MTDNNNNNKQSNHGVLAPVLTAIEKVTNAAGNHTKSSILNNVK